MKTLENPSFHDTVSALAYSLAEPHAVAPNLSPPFNDLTQFILQQHAAMPDYLRMPMRLMARVFDFAGLVNGGKFFHSQAPEVRARQIAAWKKSGIGFQRDLLRYFESLALLVLYSREAERRTSTSIPLSEPKPAQRVRVETGIPASELRSEIVVVGSGPGGAITACLLAEAGREVLLIEEGQYLPLESCAPFSRDEMQQKYRNGGQTVAMGKNKIAYVEGRCVGGGSEINSGLYHRTPPEMLERWRKEFRVDGLTDAEMQPHFETCERDVSVSLLLGAAPAASLKLHDGATRLGWKSLEIPRWFRHEAGATGGGGKRQSMTQTYIPRFLRAGGQLLPRTRVNRLRENGEGWALEAEHASGSEAHIVADALFLCAGAVHTPALLRRSGITHNVGDSLQVHPTVKIIARFPEAVNAADMGVPVHQVKEFSPRLSFGCSISSPPYLALGLIDHSEACRQTFRSWHDSAIYYAMITSEGQGTVRGVPGCRDPLVRYRLTEMDRRNLADGLKKLAQILFASGAIALYPSLTRSPELHGNDCLSEIPEILPNGLANLMTIHLFSSCPMGEDRRKCAADSFGRVHGLKCLYINDASLLCTAPGVNPQGSVMALARRNVLHFLGRN